MRELVINVQFLVL